MQASIKRKYFGTDGVRGRVGQFPISPDFAMRLGMAAGKVLLKHDQGRVIIGKDTRRSSYALEYALAAGAAASGRKDGHIFRHTIHAYQNDAPICHARSAKRHANKHLRTNSSRASDENQDNKDYCTILHNRGCVRASRVSNGRRG